MLNEGKSTINLPTAPRKLNSLREHFCESELVLFFFFWKKYIALKKMQSFNKHVETVRFLNVLIF